jgi:uncharacterized delta-60 repeat protein
MEETMPSLLKKISILCAVLYPFVSYAICDLDPTFGTGGLASTGFSDADSAGRMVLLSNGKFLISGNFLNANNIDFAVARFNADGSIDTTFGNSGVASANFPSNQNDFVAAIGVQSDGKIIAGGGTSNGSKFDIGIVRFDSAGILDPSFGTGGFTVTRIPGNRDGFIFDLQVLPDDTIVATGPSGNAQGTDYDFALAKYDANGNLDITFGNNGVTLTPLPGGKIDSANSVLVQPDQKILIGGTRDNGNIIENFADFALARYDSNGIIDPSFGNGGIVITDSPLSRADFINNTILQNDGKIIGVGTIQTGLPGETFPPRHGVISLVRYNPDGSLDYSFGDGGFVTTELPAIDDNTAWDVAIRSSGKIVIAASLISTSVSDFGMVEYNPDGTFCDSSIRTVNFPTDKEDVGIGVAIQADGKVVISGRSRVSGGRIDFALARFACSDLTISPLALPSALEGTIYDQTLSASGGTGPFIFSLDSGTLPNGILFDNTTATFSGTPAVGSAGDYDLTIKVTDTNNLAETQCYPIRVNLFKVLFDDGVLNTDWTFTGNWAETDGFLIGGLPGNKPAKKTPKKALAIATPAFSACTNCKLSTLISTAGGPGNRVSLLGWFVDKKTYVEVMFKEENNVVVLKQKMNGAIVTKGKAKFDLVPNQVYDVEVSFDGTDFHVRINGEDVFTIAAGAIPSGTVALQVKKTTGKFGPVEILK